MARKNNNDSLLGYRILGILLLVIGILGVSNTYSILHKLLPFSSGNLNECINYLELICLFMGVIIMGISNGFDIHDRNNRSDKH